MTIPQSLTTLLSAGRAVQRTLNGAGHFLMLEHPAAWADTILDFLAAHSQFPDI
jgi:pimeloyl-ACP methyl ester carboxylesterase